MLKSSFSSEGFLVLEPFSEKELVAHLQDEQAWIAGAAQREALKQITTLESQITPRRIREAVLGIDNGWLLNIEQQISELRG